MWLEHLSVKNFSSIQPSLLILRPLDPLYCCTSRNIFFLISDGADLLHNCGNEEVRLNRIDWIYWLA
jgi:hypothetical protein